MKKIFVTAVLSTVIAITCFTPSQAALIVPKSSVSNTTTTTKEEAIKSALKEFKSLSRKERNLRLKEAKAALKEFKAQKAAGEEVDTNTILLAILAILLPPLAVYLKENATDSKFVLDLLLWLIAVIGILTIPFLGWLVGLAAVIYALLIVLAK